jgi:hypothetical protein
MTSDRPPTADPPSTSTPDANPPRRGLVIALVATVILAALTATVLVVMLLGRDSPDVGAASPSPTELPTPEATTSPTADPTATPSPEPTPQTELTNGLTHLNYGARATVVANRLRFRYAPTLEGDPATVLTTGRELLILSGPITAENYEWYMVELADRDEESEIAVGWVAAVPAPADAHPDDAWLIRIDPLNCPPDAVDTPMLARLTEYAITQCDVQVSTVQGLVDTCYEGPYGPYMYEPGWAAFSCYFLRDRESTWFLPTYFPPEVDDLPERGDIVTLTGALGVDTDKYGPCTVTAAGGDFPADAVAREQQIFAASCPTKFVVNNVSVEDHITMPPPF